MKRRIVIGLVAAVFLFGADGMMLMASDGYQVRAEIRLPTARIGTFISFAPFSTPEAAEKCLASVAGRENCMGAKVALWTSATSACDAPGRGLFNKLYGSNGWGSSESECPPGGCPDEGCERTVKPPTSVVHVSGATGVIATTGGREVAILTAYHVVEGHPPAGIPVQLANGTKYKATICLKEDGSHAVNKATDIALIRIKAKKLEVEPYCSLAESQPEVGDLVWTCGFGPSDVYRQIPGEVVAFTDESYGNRECSVGDIMVVSGEAQAGDSGGPIFDATGRVCGIVSRSTRAEPMAPDRTWSTSLNQIAALCADTKFPFPWRKEVEKELEEAKQLPVPYPQAPPAGLSVKAEARISAMEARIEAIVTEYGPRFERVEGVAEAAVTAAENASTDAGKQFADDVKAIEEKAEAAEKKAEAATTKATEAVDDVKEEKKGLGDRIKERVEEKVGGLPIVQEVKEAREKIGKLQAAMGWLTKLGLPVGGGVAGLLALGIILIFFDVRKKIKEGDELACEHALRGVRKAKEAARRIVGGVRDRIHGEEDGDEDGDEEDDDPPPVKRSAKKKARGAKR